MENTSGIFTHKPKNTKSSPSGIKKQSRVKNIRQRLACFSTLSAMILALLGSIFLPANSASAASLNANYLPDGTYYFSNGLSLVMDDTDSGNVYIYDDFAINDRAYANVRRGADGYYTITNERTGLALDVSGNSQAIGANVHMWEPNGTCAQKWIFEYQRPEQYVIRNACSGRALDVSGGATNTNYTNVQMWEPNGTKAQRWELTRSDVYERVKNNDTYNIRNVVEGAVDITGNLQIPGINVHLWERNNTNAQRFIFLQHYDSSVTILNQWRTLALDVSGASKNDGANVQMWPVNHTCAQAWFIEKSWSPRYHIIRNACSGKALDISGGNIFTDGANIQIWQPNGTNAQMWRLK